ncbi:MAG: hypothetical protein M1828_005656 [Chrysothrix sp. TS-e1954]|nr:MAG: hypothetical protein M1828_005656 [Chrysothrix sp. TS-e1954]
MSSTINFEDFASELLAHFLLSCNTVNDVLALATTCRRIRAIYRSRRLPILSHAVEAQYGPLQDAIQLVTHNESQAPHIIRNVPLSTNLLQQVIAVGKVAARWEDIYPSKKWKENYEDRRLLSDAERRTFRKAVYRLWLYDAAFHNATHPRQARLTPFVVHTRAALLHNWTSTELADLVDVHLVLRDVVRFNVCPDNGTIQRKFKKRHPDSNYQLQFNMHLNYPLPSPFAPPTINDPNYKFYAKYRPSELHEPGSEGWGDAISHYYVVEDMLKLNPSQILWLRENAPSKSQVEAYVKEIGAWFDNNGETFGQTLEHVLEGRGVDVGEFMDAVAAGDLGVAGAIE